MLKETKEFYKIKPECFQTLYDRRGVLRNLLEKIKQSTLCNKYIKDFSNLSPDEFNYLISYCDFYKTNKLFNLYGIRTVYDSFNIREDNYHYYRAQSQSCPVNVYFSISYLEEDSINPKLYIEVQDNRIGRVEETKEFKLRGFDFTYDYFSTRFIKQILSFINSLNIKLIDNLFNKELQSKIFTSIISYCLGERFYKDPKNLDTKIISSSRLGGKKYLIKQVESMLCNVNVAINFGLNHDKMINKLDNLDYNGAIHSLDVFNVYLDDIYRDTKNCEDILKTLNLL